MKAPEVRVGPKQWPRIQAEKKRTKFSPLSGKLFLVFLTVSHSQAVCPPKTFKTDLLKI